MNTLRLGVNIDHVATVRNARGGAHPDPLDAALAAIAAGADGITHASARGSPPHPRRRCAPHARRASHAPLNLEMAATAEMLRIALAHASARLLHRARAARGGDDRRRPRCAPASSTRCARSCGAGRGRHPRLAVHRSGSRAARCRRRDSARRWSSCTPAPMPRARRANWSGCARRPRSPRSLGSNATPGTG